MKVRKIITFVLTLSLVLSMALVPAYAEESPVETMPASDGTATAAQPEGIIKVFNVATEGATRDPSWVDAEAGIITLPQGEAFEGGGTNHGVYGMVTNVQEGDIFYVYWVIKVDENDDADGSEIVSQDPSWMAEGGAEIGVGPNDYVTDDFDSSVYYEDINPGKWDIIACGFEVSNEDVTSVQHRLHYKNIVGMQVKYLVVTSRMIDFVVNEETGEIDGVTNDNPFITPEPTPTPTERPTEAPKATTEAPNTTAPASTTAGTANQSESDGGNTGLIIGIIVVVVVVAVVAGVVIAKKKKG